MNNTRLELSLAKFLNSLVPIIGSIKKTFAILLIWQALLQNDSLAITNENNIVSPIPTSIKGIHISNTHLVDNSNEQLFRGMRIRTQNDAKELRQKLKITDVIIFRHTDDLTDINSERKLLENAGITENHIYHIPFKWKNIESFKESCSQTVKTLKLIHELKYKKYSKIYLHCTVGEDRTGFIFGLYQILFNQLGVSETIKNELCQRGYAQANPHKPTFVVKLIHENLSPLFVKMTLLINSGKLSISNLNEKVCNEEPDLKQAQNAKFNNLLMSYLNCDPIKGI